MQKDGFLEAAETPLWRGNVTTHRWFLTWQMVRGARGASEVQTLRPYSLEFVFSDFGVKPGEPIFQNEFPRWLLMLRASVYVDRTPRDRHCAKSSLCVITSQGPRGGSCCSHPSFTDGQTEAQIG